MPGWGTIPAKGLFFARFEYIQDSPTPRQSGITGLVSHTKLTMRKSNACGKIRMSRESGLALHTKLSMRKSNACGKIRMSRESGPWATLTNRKPWKIKGSGLDKIKVIISTFEVMHVCVMWNGWNNIWMFRKIFSIN